MKKSLSVLVMFILMFSLTTVPFAQTDTVAALPESEGNTVIAWGLNTDGQCNVPEGLTNIKAIFAGSERTAVIKDDNTATIWGGYNYGNILPQGLTDIKSIAPGKYYSTALRENGKVVSWSDKDTTNEKVPAGLADPDFPYMPYGMSEGMVVETTFDPPELVPNKFITANVLVKDISQRPYSGKLDVLLIIALYDTNNTMRNVSFISKGIPYQGIETLTGGFKLPANLDGYTVKSFVWEDNDFDTMIPLSNVVVLSADGVQSSSLPTPTPTPTLVPTPTPTMFAREISQVYDHTLALLENGTVTAWGSGMAQDACNVPDGLTNVKAVAAGYGHSLALKEDGTVVAWGNNNSRQCNVPKDLTNVKAIAAGSGFSVALKEDGTVVVWGSNDYGQYNIPDGLSGVKKIAAGLFHIVALKEDGTVVAWGDNKYGQCDVPKDLGYAEDIAAGSYHTVVIKKNP